MQERTIYEKRYQKINRESKWLFESKLIVTSIFCLIALTLYLLNLVHFPVVALVFFGAVWNFFVDINTFLAFLLSVIVGFLFAMLSVTSGVYANAILYIMFYIPLQFVVWITNPKARDMSIKKDKKLSFDAVYYITIAFVLSMVILVAVTIHIRYEILLFFDVFSACMLGLSAFLESYMYREYYYVRLSALIVSIILWSLVLNSLVFSMSAIGMIILYSMYLVVDTLSFIAYMRASVPYDKDSVEELDENARKKLVKEKIDEYNKLLDAVKETKNDEDRGVNA